jgi:hypothetical protein
MPFDAPLERDVRIPNHLLDISVVDPLVRLQLTPVPESVRNSHKLRIQKLYRQNSLAKWEVVRLRPGHSLRSQLERLPIHSNTMAHDTSSAPERVIELAERVDQNIREAVFAVEYFYTDPILSVTYQHAGRQHVACLAIWDHGEIVAIAGQSKPAPAKRGFFARWFGR